MRYLFGCIVLSLTVPATPSADVKKAEALVKAYLLDVLDDPNSLKVARWGPHDLACKYRVVAYDCVYLDGNAFYDALLKLDEKGGPLPVVRLRFRAKNKAGALQLADLLFAVKGQKVVPLGEGSDSWPARLLKARAAHAELKKKFQEKP